MSTARRIAVLARSDPDRDFAAGVVQGIGHRAIQFVRPTELVATLLSGERFDLLLAACEGDQKSTTALAGFLSRMAGLGVPVLLLMHPEQLADPENFDSSGCADFVLMPCEERELIARLSSALRVAGHTSLPRPRQLVVGRYVLTPKDRTVRFGERVETLSERQFELAHFLFRHAGRTQSREQIYEAVWGQAFSTRSTRTLDVHIASMRRMLDLGSSSGEAALVTIRGVGYCLRVADPEGL